MIELTGKRQTLSSKIDEGIYKQFDEYCKEAGQSKRIALERLLVRFLEDYFSQDEKERRPL